MAIRPCRKQLSIPSLRRLRQQNQLRHGHLNPKKPSGLQISSPLLPPPLKKIATCRNNRCCSWGIWKNHLQHSHQDLGVQKIVPKLLSDYQNRSRSRSARIFHRQHPLPVLVHAGLYHDHRWDDGLISHSRDQKTEQAVDPKGPARPTESMGPCQMDNTVDGVFWLVGPHLYAHRVLRGTAINTTYTIKALCKFLQHSKKKRPAMAQQQWWLHWDNAPFHTAASVKEWMAVKGIQVMEHMPYCQIWHRPTFSCSGEYMRPLWAPPWTWSRTASRTPGKGWSRPLPLRTSQWPSGGGLSRPKNVFGSAATSFKNLEK